MSRRFPRIAIVGNGAICAEMLATLGRQRRIGSVLCVLDRPRRAKGAGPVPVVDRIEALMALRPEVVVECAGHGAVGDYGEAVLSGGADFLVASVGALADGRLHAALAKASAGESRLLVPSGAVAGLDGLLAARTAGLARVAYSSVKPPIAWKGTPAETRLDLDALKTAAVFFEGTAREAAARYPKNANVGAAVAFAGLGLDRTRVRLVADPAAAGPLGIIEAEGDFGTFRFETLAYASPANPKTSLLTAHNLVMALAEGWAFEPASPVGPSA